MNRKDVVDRSMLGATSNAAAFIDTDTGYSITEQVFNRREMARIREALMVADRPRTRAGARHLLRVPAVRELAIHPVLLRLAAAFIGAQPFPFRATLFEKSAVSNWLVAWHQDTGLPLHERIDDDAWGPWSVKGGVLHAVAPTTALTRVVALRVHLDDSTRANGPLRVLPGSHSGGILPHDEIRRLALVVTPVECVTSAGGVVAMRPMVVHASSKAKDDQPPRRVLHIEYATTMDLGAGIELAVG
jgi:ectoine hydroxylase-related dioxygenase (phytanoyl-CoA dioxygenase family)